MREGLRGMREQRGVKGSGEEREGLRNRGREGANASKRQREFSSGEGKKEVILNTQAQSRIGWNDRERK